MNAAMLGTCFFNHDLAHMAVRFGANRLSQRICMLDQAHDEFAPARAQLEADCRRFKAAMEWPRSNRLDDLRPLRLAIPGH
ncbi:hypothetical protein BE61_85350 [Bradyrhizobium elkanii USDA 61]|nr:hypothetical protein BE61_85350 [Bradyrhizobium elkanii USDA 61]